MKRVEQFILVDIQFNRWNGFYFQVFGIEAGDFERSLFYFWTNWKGHVVIDFLFLQYNSRK